MKVSEVYMWISQMYKGIIVTEEVVGEEPAP